MNKPNIDAAEDLKSTGMDRALSGEDLSNPGWSERALAAIKLEAEIREHLFVDDVLKYFTEEPLQPNAWGPVWKRAIQSGWIEEDQTFTRRKSAYPQKHARKLPVYRSLIWAGF